MTREEHLLTVVSNFVDDDLVASCSCGWEREGCHDQAEAIDAWENHCDVVFMEATEGGQP